MKNESAHSYGTIVSTPQVYLSLTQNIFTSTIFGTIGPTLIIIIPTAILEKQYSKRMIHLYQRKITRMKSFTCRYTISIWGYPYCQGTFLACLSHSDYINKLVYNYASAGKLISRFGLDKSFEVKFVLETCWIAGPMLQFELFA